MCAINSSTCTTGFEELSTSEHNISTHKCGNFLPNIKYKIGQFLAVQMKRKILQTPEDSLELFCNWKKL